MTKNELVRSAMGAVSGATSAYAAAALVAGLESPWIASLLGGSTGAFYAVYGDSFIAGLYRVALTLLILLPLLMTQGVPWWIAEPASGFLLGGAFGSICHGFREFWPPTTPTEKTDIAPVTESLE